MRTFIPPTLFLALVVVLLAQPVSAFDYTGWQLGPWEALSTADGIQLYRNTTVGDGIHAYRADVVIDAPIDVVLAAVLDHDRAKSRSFVREYDVLLDDGKQTRVYQQIQRPGLGRREFTTVGQIFRGAKGASGFTYRMVDDGHDDPDVASLAAMEGSFVLTAVGTRTRLSYRMRLAPGSWIPDFVLRPALRRGTFEVVHNLREDLR